MIFLVTFLWYTWYWQTYGSFFGDRFSDHKIHFETAAGLEKGQVPPHFLFHVTVFLISEILFISLSTSYSLVIASTHTAVFWLAALLFPMKGSIGARIEAALSLLIVYPLLIFYFLNLDDYISHGYTPPANIKHNPTILFARPFAILLFYYSCRTFLNRMRLPNTAECLMISATIIFGALAKPNCLLIFFPLTPIILFMLWLKEGRRSEILCNTLLWTIPALLVLIFQFSIEYAGNSSQGIIWSPFAVIREFNTLTMYFAKLFLSAFFPLYVFILAMSYKKVSKEFLFSLIVFLTSLIPFLFLAESGRKLHDGNWGWGGQLGLLIFFLASFQSYLSLRHEGVLKRSHHFALRTILLGHIASYGFYFAFA